MTKARALDRRRKSIRNIRKITRTMELIATARFRQAMARAESAAAYTERIARLAADLARGGQALTHPLLESRPEVRRATMLVLTGNRGLCGGYNANLVRLSAAHYRQLHDEAEQIFLEVSGKRGISALRFRRIPLEETYTQFEDQPRYHEVNRLADRYLAQFVTGAIDRLDVVYTKFVSRSTQTPVAQTLLPLAALTDGAESDEQAKGESLYEFLPSAESILDEVVPMSFRMRLFKCFLDAAVSEQIARMQAMKAATENADEMIRYLSMTYNRARQSQITGEIMEVIGGVEALQE